MDGGRGAKPKKWSGLLSRFKPSGLRPSASASTHADVIVSDSATPTVEDAHLRQHWKLDTMISWLKVVKEGVGIQPLPYVKGCVGLTLAIAENWQMAQCNVEEGHALIKKLYELMQALLDPQRQPVLSSSPVQEALIKAHQFVKYYLSNDKCIHGNMPSLIPLRCRALKEIAPFIEQVVKRSRAKRFLMAAADRAQLAKYRTDISDIIDLFTVWSLFTSVLDRCDGELLQITDQGSQPSY